MTTQFIALALCQVRIRLVEAAYIARCQILHAEQAVEDHAFSTDRPSSDPNSKPGLQAPVHAILQLLGSAHALIVEKQVRTRERGYKKKKKKRLAGWMGGWMT